MNPFITMALFLLLLLSAPAFAGQVRKPEIAGLSPQDKQLTELLVSSLWCSFNYSKSTSTSSMIRLLYLPGSSDLLEIVSS